MDANRGMALGVAILAGLALAGQYAVVPQAQAQVGVAARVWLMAGYFTVLTNALVCATMALRAAGLRIAAGWALAMAVAILVVGAVYHLVLARLWAPQGLAWWADQGLHTGVPLAYAAWWLGFADKRLGWSALGQSLIWPLVYCGYALIRGAMTGFWPYPFLDGTALSPARLALNIAGLSVAFALLAALLIMLSRPFSR